MSLGRVKTWIAEILTYADLNAEFDNILNNPGPLITGATLTGGLTFGAVTTFGSTNPAANLLNMPCDGRLTLTTATPVTTADVTAAETLYWTPYIGNRIALYDGTNWDIFTTSEVSIDVPDATNCYDVFMYENSGSPALELLAWTNETTRATALAYQNGVLCKTGALTRRYVGTFYSTTAGNGQIEDSFAKRNLWNYYNRDARPMQVLEATDSWTYTTATIRQARGSTANQLEFVVGVSEDAVTANVAVIVGSDQAANTVNLAVGIGLDSTTAIASSIAPNYGNLIANVPQPMFSSYVGYPAVGRHYLAWLEYSTAAGTTTWYGDNGVPTRQQSGIQGVIWG